MFDNTDLLFSSNKHGTNLSGNEANASSVGANTVNGPFGSDTVSTKSAAPNAATKVLKVPALVAVVGISTNDVSLDDEPPPHVSRKAATSTSDGTNT